MELGVGRFGAVEAPESFGSMGSVRAHEAQRTSSIKARNLDFIL